MYCLSPKVESVPEGLYLCPTCVIGGDTPDVIEYGLFYYFNRFLNIEHGLYI
jgi:hypothetical protein